MTPITRFQERRARVLALMGEGLAIVPTAPERIRNRDSHHPYRFDSYFWYLSGFAEPEAVLVLVAGESPKSLLFCREKNEEREIWDGYRFGPQAAGEAFGFDAAHPIGELPAMLPELLANQPRLWFAFGADADWDRRIADALNAVRARSRAGARAPDEIRDLRALLDPLRLIKDDHEIACLQRAADVASRAHARAMAACRPGRHEYEIEAEFLHEFRRAGMVPSYPPIVAGGRNACVLHYHENAAPLVAGELLLIDAGCEAEGYASDITRTFPVDGRFTGAAGDLYQLVLAAQQAAIAAVRPGARFDEPHNAALRVLTAGLVELGLLSGEVDALLAAEAYKRFYMHRTSHWLGLDVHDAGDYRQGDEWLPLAAGMVLTIEPGCYVRPAEDIPQAFWNIGVRIEDDVLVGADGPRVLSSAPKEVADIEALMADG
jgi:Xaa-Pro aminopeptidase